MTETEEVNHLVANEFQEKDLDASMRSRITNSTDPHSIPGVVALHEECGSALTGPHFPTLQNNGAARNALIAPGVST